MIFFKIGTCLITIAVIGYLIEDMAKRIERFIK